MSQRYHLAEATLLLYCAFSMPADAACTAYPSSSGYPYYLQNSQVADASQVMADFNAVLTSPCLTGNVGIGTTNPQGTLEVANTSGSTLTLDKPGGAAITYSKSGTQEFLIEDDSATSSALAFYGWTGASWTNLVDFKNNGNVGVGTASPSYTLHVNGTAYATGAAGALSDIRHKKDIAPLARNTLAAVMALRPVSFEWKEPRDDGMKGRQMGFIAQDVEKVLPSVVLTETDAERTKGLKYNELIAVLTKAMQEQEQEIASLRQANATVATTNQALRSKDASLEARLDRVERLLRVKTASSGAPARDR